MCKNLDRNFMESDIWLADKLFKENFINFINHEWNAVKWDHFIPTEQLKVKGQTIASVGKDVAWPELSCIDEQGIKWCNHFAKLFGSFL